MTNANGWKGWLIGALGAFSILMASVVLAGFDRVLDGFELRLGKAEETIQQHDSTQARTVAILERVERDVAELLRLRRAQR